MRNMDKKSQNIKGKEREKKQTPQCFAPHHKKAWGTRTEAVGWWPLSGLDGGC